MMTILASAIKLELARPQVIAQYGADMGAMLIAATMDKHRQEWAAEQALKTNAGATLKMGKRGRL